MRFSYLLAATLVLALASTHVSADSAVDYNQEQSEMNEVEKQRLAEEKILEADEDELPKCAEFTSCAECVFDATFGLMTEYANCTWCPSEKKCVETAKENSAEAMCAGGQFFGGVDEPKCQEMQCVAADDWTNLYFCRPWSRAVLTMAILLGAFSFLFYYWWLAAIIQKPWKYPRLHDVVDSHVSNSFLSEMRTNEIADEKPTPLHHDHQEGDDSESEEGDEEELIICQICKIRSPTPNGDAVCAWCNIARLSFMPLVVGSTVSASVLILIFLVGLKPWFADWYYFFMLLVGFGAYGIFFHQVWGNRVPIVGDSQRRLSSFIHLALTLRGRSLLEVFPNVEDMEDSSNIAAVEMEVKVTEEPNASPPSAADRRASVTSLNLGGHPLRAGEVSGDATHHVMKYHSAIPEYMRTVIDEHVDPILWSYEPDRNDIIADNFWLLHFFSSLALIGLWMLCATLVQSEWTLWKITSPALFFGVGGTLLIFGSYFALHTYNSTVKYYVMTKKTLYAFSQNGSGAVHHATPIEFVRCASVQTYACFGMSLGWSRVIQSFSWTAPQEGRRMPSITAKHFVGLPAEALTELRTQFTKQVNININSDAIKDDFAHLRKAWTLHIAVQLLMLYLLPIFLLHTYMMPFTFAFFGLVAFGSMPICFLYRGWRVHKLTVVGHNVAKENFFWKRGERAVAKQKEKSFKGVAESVIAKKRVVSALKLDSAAVDEANVAAAVGVEEAQLSPRTPQRELTSEGSE